MTVFDGVDACIGPVNDFEEAFVDEQLRHREMIVEDASGRLGEWRHVGNPIKLAMQDGDALGTVPPELGEHTSDVLRTLGIDEAREAEMRASGAI
jgi:crotonobetainyl-CoA:carnitine CoA-transferase CaiB-like acyl-CoA transferase